MLSGWFLGGFLVVYGTFVLTPVGQLVDASSLGAFEWARDRGGFAVFESREVLVALPVAVAAVALVVSAMRRRAADAAAGLAALAVVAALATVLKRAVLPRPDLGDFAYPENTFPSGHAAVALCAAVVIVWLTPRRATQAAALGGAVVTVLVCVFSVASFAHRASDVIGGALLVGVVAPLLARRLPRDTPRRRRRAHGLTVAAAAGAAAFGVSAALMTHGADAAGPMTLALVLSSSAVAGAVLLVATPPERGASRGEARTANFRRT